VGHGTQYLMIAFTTEIDYASGQMSEIYWCADGNTVFFSLCCL